MQAKTRARMAWPLWGLGVALSGLGLWLVGTNDGGFGDDLFIVPVVASIGGVGALIASRRPDHAIGWILLAAAIGAVIGFVGTEYPRYAVLHSFGPRWLATGLAWIGEWIWLPTFGLIPTFLLLLFPDGRLPSPRWPRSGSGTRNMADRLEALGGELEIRSAPGEGTVVAGRVPVGEPR
jgi:hypothetical protein